jgi:hypothetical protein
VRQFGFERNGDGSVTFYTRGVSQADWPMVDPIARYAQGEGWTAMMQGISDEMNRRAQQQVSDPSSISRNNCQQVERDIR